MWFTVLDTIAPFVGLLLFVDIVLRMENDFPRLPEARIEK